MKITQRKKKIETQTQTWITQITHAANSTIPKSKYKTLPHVKTNHNTRTLQTQYNALKIDIEQHGTNYYRYTRFITLRQQIQQEHIALHTATWNNIIDNIDIDPDAKKFWSQIKKLQGSEGKTKATYIKDHNDKKIYDGNEKETIFRKYWENVFKISEEENNTFDKDNDRHWNTFTKLHPTGTAK